MFMNDTICFKNLNFNPFFNLNYFNHSDGSNKFNLITTYGRKNFTLSIFIYYFSFRKNNIVAIEFIMLTIYKANIVFGLKTTINKTVNLTTFVDGFSFRSFVPQSSLGYIIITIS